jgi:hypothetical protein
MRILSGSGDSTMRLSGEGEEWVETHQGIGESRVLTQASAASPDQPGRERTSRGDAHEQEGVPAAVGEGDLKPQVVVDELHEAARRWTSSGSWRR